MKPFQGSWALPGGMVSPEESLESAVFRELKEETSLSPDYLEQLYTFGDPHRDPRKRTISVAYYGLIRPEAHELQAHTDVDAVQWFNIKQLPTLAFDHDLIVKVALERLRAKITYEPVGFELLDEKFLFSDLEKLYMTLLDRGIDRRNFRKKVMSFNLLEPLDEKVKQGAGRPAQLYRFNQQKYFELKAKGFLFEI